MKLINLLYRDSTKITPLSLEKLKRSWAKDIGHLPKHSELLSVYQKLIEQKKLSPTPLLENIFRTRRGRTLSGVSPMAVMTKPYPCPGNCIYCPQEEGMPKSYLSDEPAAQRAKMNDFDPSKQIKSRLQQLKRTGHPTTKVELIVIGGSFSSYPKKYKTSFFKDMFDTLNGQSSKNLKQAQEKNETADNRVVAISIETRPDLITPEEVILMRSLGVTKIQLGVQAFDDKILKQVNRGHGLKEVSQATRLLRDAGFKICYHLMPNLPGSTPEYDIEMAKIMYQNKRFKPDYLKIYPTQVIPGTVLHRLWEKGKYQTYSEKDIKFVLKEIKKITPPWTRIDRLVRDISKQWVSSGTEKSNLRQVIQKELQEEGFLCQCIRCREVKNSIEKEVPSLKRRSYTTLGGKEIFLTWETDKYLYSILRLRLPEKDNPLFPELKDCGMVREVHTYGKSLALSQRQEGKTQHQGMGRQLMSKAEKIALKEGYSHLAVISSIGTRDYYRQLGYRLQGEYMVKLLQS